MLKHYQQPASTMRNGRRTTSCTQPLDQGVIKVTKQKYRRRLVQRFLSEIDYPSAQKKSSVTVLDAIHYIIAAWQDVTKETVENCFKKAGFLFHDDDSIDFDDPDGDISLTDEDRQKLREQEVSLEDYLNIDEQVLTCSEQCLDEIIADVSVRASTEDNNENDDSGTDDDEEDISELPPTKS